MLWKYHFMIQYGDENYNEPKIRPWNGFKTLICHLKFVLLFNVIKSAGNRSRRRHCRADCRPRRRARLREQRGGLLHLCCKKFSCSEYIDISFKSPLRAVSSGKIQGFPLTASKQALIYASPIEQNCDIEIRNLLVQRRKKPKINPSCKRDGALNSAEVAKLQC